MFCGVSSTTRTRCATLFLPTFDEALHGGDELLQADRLADEGVEARGGDLAAVARRHRGGERDHRDARRLRVRAQLLERFDAVDAWELDVHQDEVGLLLLRELHALLARDRFDRLIAFRLEDVARELHVFFIVFNDKNQAHWRTGNVKVNVDPLPGALSRRISPPCSSTKRLVSARPSPVPSALRV